MIKCYKLIYFNYNKIFKRIFRQEWEILETKFLTLVDVWYIIRGIKKKIILIIGSNDNY